MRKSLLLLLLIAVSCKKDECNSTAEILDPEDITVVVGWPVTLNTGYYSTTITNEWSGPNNWKATTKNGIATQLLTTEASYSHTGDYSVESYSYDNCLLYQKTIHVQVIEPPHAPCSVNANAIVITSPITYEALYSQVTSYVENNHFVVKASNGNKTITLTFKDAQEPKPGIHKLYQGFITTGQVPQSYSLDSGEFYVQKTNGHLVISFCDAIFYNGTDIETDVHISGEITTS